MLDKEIKKYINRLLKDIRFYINLNNCETSHLNHIKFNSNLINDWINLELQKRNKK